MHLSRMAYAGNKKHEKWHWKASWIWNKSAQQIDWIKNASKKQEGGAVFKPGKSMFHIFLWDAWTLCFRYLDIVFSLLGHCFLVTRLSGLDHAGIRN